MEPNSGGNPNPTDNINRPDTFASAITAALAHLTGKDKEKENPHHDDDSANPSDRTHEPVARPGQPTTALGMHSTDSSGGVDDNVTSETAVNHTELKSEYKSEEEPSFSNETDELQDVEMAEEEEATPSSTERQLQAVYGEQTVNVRIKANDEIVMGSVADGGNTLLCYSFVTFRMSYMRCLTHSTIVLGTQKWKGASRAPTPPRIMINAPLKPRNTIKSTTTSTAPAPPPSMLLKPWSTLRTTTWIIKPAPAPRPTTIRLLILLMHHSF